MIVQRFYDDGLAQASYLIGCGATGDAVVIDPNRDLGQYLAVAAAEGVRINHVTETHIHADFVSGSRELARTTGARLYLSDEGGADWKYGFAAESDAVLVRHGHRIQVGNVVLEVVHTPGHTPEHLGFLVVDTAAADQPIAMVTGDFVFVGDVGRPDLLEKAANIAGTMEAAARTLFRSLKTFKEQPDWLQIWPGHGAGSACGKGLSAVPHSTVGYERRFNWAFGIETEAEFVAAVLAGQPEPPSYFAVMKRINREGPRLLGGFSRPRRLDNADLAPMIAAATPVVDTRPAADFAAGHVPGTLNIPLNGSFTTWAGWLIDYERDFALIVDDTDPARLDRVVRDLAMIGLDRVAGYYPVEAVTDWQAAGGTLASIRSIDPADLAGKLERSEVTVIDVRGRAEWEAGNIPGADHIPVGYLAREIGRIPKDKPVVVHCQSGGRAAIAASVLQALGVEDVINLKGGITAWQKQGLPVASGLAATAGSEPRS